MSAFNRYRDVAIVVTLLAVPFFFLRANMKKQSSINALDRAILRISAPIEFAASSLARGVSNVCNSYLYLVDVKADKDKLAYENARLREENHRLAQKEVEIRELRRLLELKQSVPGDLVSAQVIAVDFTEFFRVTRVVLDRGSHNIRPHMPVLSPDGVIGKTLRVAGDSVDVQLAIDAQFGVDVVDERTRARGYVRGTGDPSRYSCRVEDVDSRDEVEIGDVLVTSGKGKMFPEGLPVARVTKVVKRESGRYQEIEAVPTANFSRLDAVLILVTPEVVDAEESTAKKKESK